MKKNPFSEEQIIERLRFDNPWWYSKELSQYYKQWQERLYFKPFLDIVLRKDAKNGIVLMGPARAGKTVMLFQCVQSLMENGISPRKICYVPVETPVYHNNSLEQLFDLCKKALGDNSSEDFYIIYDGIQYQRNWEAQLKFLVDSFHQSKFIVCGSAAAALKLKSNEPGAGTFTEFILPPLTFYEYIHLQGEQHLIKKISVPDEEGGAAFTFSGSNNYEALNEHFLKYINFGGYPEVVFNPQIQVDPGLYIKNNIIDKVLQRDLPGLYGIRDVQELNALFNIIAYNTGNEFTLEDLSKQSGIDKITLKKYIEYMEASFLVKVVYPVGLDTKRFLRAARFKIYLTNPSLRCALFTPIKETDENMGQLVETAIFSQWMHWGEVSLHYAAWNGGEVDMVVIEPDNKPRWILEVKWSNFYYNNPGKLKSLLKYCIENEKNRAFTTTINCTGAKTVNNIGLIFFPAASYCYQVGKIA
ncbi:MAG TPA: ATP-binding protein [Chitinophagaceae bacterium]|nr:ATP-binding protein [Chitinophagaceae bacterium]